ncbi:hypothetical protein D9M68_20290 [compost metagenome]
MNDLNRVDVVTIINDIQDLVTCHHGDTPEEQSVFGGRCKKVVWDITQMVCGFNPSDRMELSDLVQTISVHRADIHQALNDRNLSYFISVHDGMLVGEIVDRASGQMIHCPIASGYDDNELNNVFRNSRVLMLSTYH